MINRGNKRIYSTDDHAQLIAVLNDMTVSLNEKRKNPNSLLTRTNNQWIITRVDGVIEIVTTTQLLKALITSRNHSLTGTLTVVVNKNIFIITVDNLVSLIDNAN